MNNEMQKNYTNPYGLNETTTNQSNHQLNSSSSSSPFSILTNLSSASSNGSQQNHFNMNQAAAAAAALTNHFQHDLQNQHLLKSLNLNENLFHQSTSLNNQQQQQQSAALMNFLPNYQSLLTTQNKFNSFNPLAAKQQSQSPFFPNHPNISQTNSSPAFAAAALAFYGSIFNNQNSFMLNQNNDHMNGSANNKQNENRNQNVKQTSHNEQVKQLESLNLMHNNSNNKNNQNMLKSLNHSLNLIDSAKPNRTKLNGSLPTSSPTSLLSNSPSSSLCSIQSEKNNLELTKNDKQKSDSNKSQSIEK